MSDESKEDNARMESKQERHYFFLNPYERMAFTRCPKCEEKTEVRKHCLIIHIEPKQILLLNKVCRYCSRCDLIIVKKADLESLLAAACEQKAPDIMGNEYFVFGTMDRKDWKRSQTEKMSMQEAVKCSHPFKDSWKFDIIGGWHPKEPMNEDD